MIKKHLGNLFKIIIVFFKIFPLSPANAMFFFRKTDSLGLSSNILEEGIKPLEVLNIIDEAFKNQKKLRKNKQLKIFVNSFLSGWFGISIYNTPEDFQRLVTTLSGVWIGIHTAYLKIVTYNSTVNIIYRNLTWSTKIVWSVDFSDSKLSITYLNYRSLVKKVWSILFSWKV